MSVCVIIITIIHTKREYAQVHIFSSNFLSVGRTIYAKAAVSEEANGGKWQ